MMQGSSSSTSNAGPTEHTTRERKRGVIHSGNSTDSSEMEHLLSATTSSSAASSVVPSHVGGATSSTAPVGTAGTNLRDGGVTHHNSGSVIAASSKSMSRRNNTMSYYFNMYCTSTNSIKLIVLVVLSLQNSLFTVLRRYSQGIREEMYSKYEVLMVGEVIKLLFSSYMIHRAMKSEAMNLDRSNNNNKNASSATIDDDGVGSGHSSISSNYRNLSLRLIYLTNHSRKMIGLALIYGVMNVLSFVALRNIDAGTFTIFAQCKILTTAAFSAILLQRHYSLTKWRALLSLVFGVLLFSEPIWNNNTSSSTTTQSPMVMVGIIAVLIEVTLSGFASIYFEKVIKLDPLPLTIWERNFQLALGSIPVYMAFIIYDGGGSVGYFGGWSMLAWIVSILGAAGGLLVALSIKYGDAILKTLATTASIILSSLLDHYFLHGPLTPIMIIAAVQVIIAICNYTFDSTPEISASSHGSSGSSSSNSNDTTTIKDKSSMDVELATTSSSNTDR